MILLLLKFWFELLIEIICLMMRVHGPGTPSRSIHLSLNSLYPSSQPTHHCHLFRRDTHILLATLNLWGSERFTCCIDTIIYLSGAEPFCNKDFSLPKAIVGFPQLPLDLNKAPG